MQSEPTPRMRPLKHAALASLAVFLLGVLLGGAGVFTNPEKVGQVTGAMILWVFLAVLASSWAYQRGRRLMAGVVAALAILLVPGIAALWTVAALNGGEQIVPLSAAEQNSLKPSPDGARLCSSQLGFSFPAPGPLTTAPAVQAQLNAALLQQHMYSWAFENSATGERLIVYATKGIGAKEASFRGFTRGFSKSISQQSKFIPGDRRFSWSPSMGEYQLSLSSPDGALDFRCLATSSSGHLPALIVCAQTVAASSQALAALRNGLKLNGC